MVGLAPGIKPAGIKLAANQGAAGHEFAGFLEIAGGVAAEIGGLKEVGAETVFHLGRRVAGEERDIEPGIQQGLANIAHVFGILAVKAIFILRLHHQNRAAMGDLLAPEHAADFLEVGFYGIDISGIARTQFNAVILEQPPRRTAHLPFGAGIRAGPENDPQPFFLGNLAKLGVVRLAGPDELAGLRLVQIPEQVGADRIEAHGLGEAEPLAPVFLGHAGGVDFAAADLEALAIQQEIVGANGKVMDRQLRRQPGRQQRGGSQQGEQSFVHSGMMSRRRGNGNRLFLVFYPIF